MKSFNVHGPSAHLSNHSKRSWVRSCIIICKFLYAKNKVMPSSTKHFNNVLPAFFKLLFSFVLFVCPALLVRALGRTLDQRLVFVRKESKVNLFTIRPVDLFWFLNVFEWMSLCFLKLVHSRQNSDLSGLSSAALYISPGSCPFNWHQVFPVRIIPFGHKVANPNKRQLAFNHVFPIFWRHRCNSIKPDLLHCR